MIILTFSTAIVNPAFADVDLVESHISTTSPCFTPTAEDAAEWAGVSAEMNARDELMAEWATLDRLEDEASAFGNPWDLVSDGELAECRGYHPANAWE